MFLSVHSFPVRVCIFIAFALCERRLCGSVCKRLRGIPVRASSYHFGGGWYDSRFKPVASLSLELSVCFSLSSFFFSSLFFLSFSYLCCYPLLFELINLDFHNVKIFTLKPFAFFCIFLIDLCLFFHHKWFMLSSFRKYAFCAIVAYDFL